MILHKILNKLWSKVKFCSLKKKQKRAAITAHWEDQRWYIAEPKIILQSILMMIKKAPQFFTNLCETKSLSKKQWQINKLFSNFGREQNVAGLIKT